MTSKILTNYLIILILIFSHIISSQVAGQEKTSDINDNNEINLENYEVNESKSYETVISADRTEIKKFESTRSIAIIKKDKIYEKHARSVPESLQNETGVFVQKTNRGSGAPIIRGLIGPQNLILIDDVRFNTSTFRTGPNQYLSTLDPYSISHLELVRGPSSVLYGNGAMGGVIHAITIDPMQYSNGIHATAGTWFASADKAPGGMLSVINKTEHLGFLGGISFSNFSTLRAGNGIIQPLTNYTTANWRTKFVYAPQDTSFTITGSYLGTVVDNAGRTDKLGKGDVRLYDNSDHLTYLSLVWKGKKMLQEIKTTASYHRVNENILRYQCQINQNGTIKNIAQCLTLSNQFLERKRNYSDVVDSFGIDASATMNLFSKKAKLVTGAEYYHDLVGSSLNDARTSDDFVFTSKNRGNFSPGSKYDTLGIFAYSDILIWDFGLNVGEIHINGGTRFSNFGAFAPNVPEIGDINYSYNGIVSSAGIQWLTADKFNFYGSFSQGFRAPNLQETTVLGDTGSKFEIPNQNLKPERSNTIEIGSSFQFNAIEFGATWFYSMIDQIIDEESASYQNQEEIDGAPVVKRINANSGLYHGLEGALSIHLWQFLISTNLTWMNGEITKDNETHFARRVPPIFGTAGIRYNHADKSFYTEFYVNFAGQQNHLHPNDKKDLRICEDGYFSGILLENCSGTNSWYTLNINGGFRLFETTRLDFALHNLTDRLYKTHGSGFYAPGFDARTTVIVEF